MNHAGYKSFTIPTCSVHRTNEHVRRDPDGKWVCFQCADEFLQARQEATTQGRSVGGVALPAGVRDKRRVKRSFTEAYPNRRTRRAYKKARQG